MGFIQERSLKKRHDTCSPLWKQIALLNSAHKLAPAFLTFAAPPQKKQSVNRPNSSPSFAFSSRGHDKLCILLSSINHVISTSTVKYYTTVGEESPQKTRIFRRGTFLIVAPLPSQDNPYISACSFKFDS